MCSNSSVFLSESTVAEVRQTLGVSKIKGTSLCFVSSMNITQNFSHFFNSYGNPKIFICFMKMHRQCCFHVEEQVFTQTHTSTPPSPPAHLHSITNILLIDALLQVLVTHPIAAQLTQHVGRLGLLELQVDPSIISGDNAVRGAGYQTQLIHCHARTPRRVGAGRQRGGIRRGSVSDHLQDKHFVETTTVIGCLILGSGTATNQQYRSKDFLQNCARARRKNNCCQKGSET